MQRGWLLISSLDMVSGPPWYLWGSMRTFLSDMPRDITVTVCLIGRALGYFSSITQMGNFIFHVVHFSRYRSQYSWGPSQSPPLTGASGCYLDLIRPIWWLLPRGLVEVSGDAPSLPVQQPPGPP